jgi:2-amino-4-hydroxy-6-hydroxymethyldihydropteridine diphosphokinase
MNTAVYLLTGTNMGDKEQNLELAVHEIGLLGSILNVSSVYRTAAWGNQDQEDFLNQVVCISTSLSPEMLLDSILLIEKKMGRLRTEKWGERLIDIDILFYGSALIKTKNLTIPHPQIPNRRFTLVPLQEIAASFIHPLLKVSVDEMLKSCTDPLAVKKLEL